MAQHVEDIASLPFFPPPPVECNVPTLGADDRNGVPLKRQNVKLSAEMKTYLRQAFKTWHGHPYDRKYFFASLSKRTNVPQATITKFMYNDRRRNPQLYDDIRRQKPRRNRPNQENEHDGSDNQESYGSGPDKKKRMEQRGKVPYGRPAPSEYHLPPSLAFHPPTEDRYDRCNGSNGSSDEDEDGYMSVDDDTSSRGHDGRRRRRRADRRSVESLKEEELLAVNQLLSIRSLLQPEPAPSASASPDPMPESDHSPSPPCPAASVSPPVVQQCPPPPAGYMSPPALAAYPYPPSSTCMPVASFSSSSSSAHAVAAAALLHFPPAAGWAHPPAQPNNNHHAANAAAAAAAANNNNNNHNGHMSMSMNIAMGMSGRPYGNAAAGFNNFYMGRDAAGQPF